MKLIIEESDTHQRIAIGTYPIEGHIEGSSFVSAFIGQREVPKGVALNFDLGPPTYEKARDIVAYLNSIYSQIPLAPDRQESWEDAAANPLEDILRARRKIDHEMRQHEGETYTRALTQAFNDRGAQVDIDFLARTAQAAIGSPMTGYKDIAHWAGVQVKNHLIRTGPGGSAHSAYSRECRFDPSTHLDRPLQRVELTVDDLILWEPELNDVYEIRHTYLQIENRYGMTYTLYAGKVPDGNYRVTKINRGPISSKLLVTLVRGVAVSNPEGIALQPTSNYASPDAKCIACERTEGHEDDCPQRIFEDVAKVSEPYHVYKREDFFDDEDDHDADERTEGDDLMDFFRN